MQFSVFDTNQPAFQSLRDIYAESARRIMVWCGAGLSRSAGLPTWRELKEHLEEQAEAKVRSLADSQQNRHLTRCIHTSRQSTNFWLAFSKLREALGKTTYRDLIKSKLGPASTTAIPSVYTTLWKMRISGILTLNIDKLATRAFSEVHHGKAVHEFPGIEAARHLHLLYTSSPIIANLHGVWDNENSWIFTKDSLEKLLSSPGYRAFVHSIFATHTVLFIGISADDVAAGGFLERLIQEDSAIQLPSHFWLTDRNDTKLDSWAERNGIRVVRYVRQGESHAEMLEALEAISRYVPSDQQPPPVMPIGLAPVGELPAPSELARHSPEEIRKLLNARAAEILSKRDQISAYAEFEEFRRRYVHAIHSARFVDFDPPNNIVFDYTIAGDKMIGEGAFGDVYKANGRDGKVVAIKMLRQEVRDGSNMLASFRRGVHSMQILARHGVPGIVPYLEAYELPACVVMEFVDGPNLQTAVEQGQLSLVQKFRIAESIIDILMAGHRLEERVLHRDVRPANIMLRNYYPGAEDFEVVLLDFDLSWHRDAIERSVYIAQAAAHGYAAPEQQMLDRKTSSRSALVDSFGVGMTIYYLFAGKHPGQGIVANHEVWSKIVGENIRIGMGRTEWRSLPARLSRLILGATREKQNERLQLSTMHAELGSLRVLEADQRPMARMEYWAEEILVRAFGNSGYSWDSDKVEGGSSVDPTDEIVLTPREIERTIDLRINWVYSGTSARRSTDKSLREIAAQIKAALHRASWTVQNFTATDRAIHFDAHLKADRLSDLAKVSRGLADARGALARLR